jgi:hypothetical protein
MAVEAESMDEDEDEDSREVDLEEHIEAVATVNTKADQEDQARRSATFAGSQTAGPIGIR